MNKNKPHINKVVVGTSVIAGLLSWFICRYLYSFYHENISGPILIGTLCSILFIAVFGSVLVSSKITGSFDEESKLYINKGRMAIYFLGSLATTMILSMVLEYIYELTPKEQVIQPSSYIFVIDESGSMSGNDPDGLRYEAIPEIMKASEEGLPYMVYTFSNDTRIVRNMGPLEAEYSEIPNIADGGTAILGTIQKLLQDYKDGVWEGGENPKVIFLTDGAATDLNKGFFLFKGDMPAFQSTLQEYDDLGISISTVGLGKVDRDIMMQMAETTNGVFVNITHAEDLASAMKVAATSYSERDLLSIRYMKNLNFLYGILRILFLTIIGGVIGSSIVFAYMEDSSIPLIIGSSLICSFVGSTLFELGLKIGFFQSILWIILWGLFSLTIGLIYPKLLYLNDRRITVCTSDSYQYKKQKHN